MTQPNQGWIADLLQGNTSSLTAGFKQPPVGSTVTVSVSSTLGAIVGKGAEVAGGGFYVITAIGTNTVTLLNRTSAVNAPAGQGVGGPGTSVTFGGPGSPLSGNLLNGQSQQLVNGQLIGVGQRPCINAVSYGADSTGVNDSTVGLQAAVDAAAGLVPVYLPPSTSPQGYRISAPVFLPTSTMLEADHCGRGNPAAIIKDGTSGLYWATGGGGYIGDFLVAAPNNVAASFLTTTGGFTWLKMGSPVFSHLYFAEVPMGSFNGMSQMELEFRLNISANPSLNVDVFYCGGSETANQTRTEAIRLYFNGTTSPTDLTFKLVTTGNPSGATAVTTTHPITFAVDHAIKVNYDGANIRIYVDGTLCATTACTGTIVQKWWEEPQFGQSQGSGQYPMGGTSPFDSMPSRIAEIRKSNIARTTGSSYTPKTTPWTIADCDVNTDLIISFAPAFQLRAPTFFMAGCGHANDFGLSVFSPANVLMNVRNVCNVGTDNATGQQSIIRNIGFQSWNGCVQAELCTSVRTFNCTFKGRKGITRMNNCYYAEDHGAVFTVTGGSADAHPSMSHSWGAAYIAASGVGIVDNAQFAGVITAHHGLVFNGCGAEVLHLKINTMQGQTAIYLNNPGEMFIDGWGVGDEGGGYLNSAIIYGCVNGSGGASNLVIRNFGINEAGGTSAPLIKIDGGINISIDADCLGQHAASVLGLAPSGSKPTYPVRITNCYQGQEINNAYIPWSDGNVDCIVEPLETNGRDGDSLTSNATAITLPWGALNGRTSPDFTCRTLVFKGSPTGDVTVTPPTNAKGHERRIVNALTTVHNVIFGGVTIANGKSAYVESNGSGWERGGPDT